MNSEKVLRGETVAVPLCVTAEEEACRGDREEGLRRTP